jgi:predicted nucleic acid-binding Zn ribbon protein
VLVAANAAASNVVLVKKSRVARPASDQRAGSRRDRSSAAAAFSGGIGGC